MAKKKHLWTFGNAVLCGRNTINCSYWSNGPVNITCIGCLKEYIAVREHHIQAKQNEIAWARRQIEAEYEKGA